MENKKISLKENGISSLIQKADREIRLATKKGDLPAARNFRINLKNQLEKAGYNWKQDPYAVELIQEAAKIQSKQNKEAIKVKSKPTIEERKIALLTKKIEEATGKKVTFKEAEGDEQINPRPGENRLNRKKEEQKGIENCKKWISELKSNSYNLLSYSKNTSFGKEKLSKYTDFLNKIYSVASKLEENL